VSQDRGAGRFSCSIAGDSTLLAAQRILRGAYVLHGNASKNFIYLKIQIRCGAGHGWNRSNSVGTNKECKPLICGLLYRDTWPASRSVSLTFLIGDADHESDSRVNLYTVFAIFQCKQFLSFHIPNCDLDYTLERVTT